MVNCTVNLVKHKPLLTEAMNFYPKAYIKFYAWQYKYSSKV